MSQSETVSHYCILKQFVQITLSELHALTPKFPKYKALLGEICKSICSSSVRWCLKIIIKGLRLSSSFGGCHRCDRIEMYQFFLIMVSHSNHKQAYTVKENVRRLFHIVKNDTPRARHWSQEAGLPVFFMPVVPSNTWLIVVSHHGADNLASKASKSRSSCHHSMMTHLHSNTNTLHLSSSISTALIARFMGPTRGPSGTDRTQVGPMLAPWTLLSGWLPVTVR